ncbi:hypothetical protein D3C81_1833170 [compost metagenome]
MFALSIGSFYLRPLPIGENLLRGKHGCEIHPQNSDGHVMHVLIIRRAGVLNDEDPIVFHESVPNRGVHAAFGRDACNDQLVYV